MNAAPPWFRVAAFALLIQILPGPAVLRAQCNRQLDSVALATLYANNSNQWKQRWNLQQPMSSWYGITLNAEGCVTSIELINHGISGNLPEIAPGTFIALEEVRLDSNNLFSSLPPSWGGLPNLRILNLAGNKFSGSLPASWTTFPKLIGLWLSGNSFLNGSIPPALGNMKTLQYLDLGGNSLRGNLPQELGNLVNLEFLWLYDNPFLDGPIPAAWANMKSLKQLFAYGCGFSGELPGFMASLPNLEYLSLADCRFEGPIPLNWHNFPALKGLWISDNLRLSGPIPAAWAKIPSLQTLILSNCRFSGALPPEFAQTTSLREFAVDGNHLSGAFPDLSRNPLQLLWLQENEFDALPNLSGISSWDPSIPCQMGENAFSFEDLLPSRSIANFTTWDYAPQDSLLRDSVIQAALGSPLTLDLGFDANVPNNVYRWIQNGVQDTVITGVNKRFFPALSAADLGTYRVQVTNPLLPDLTLHTRSFRIEQGACPVLQSSFADTICQGGEYRWAGRSFNTAGSFMQTFKAASGCDSIVTLRLALRQPPTLTPMVSFQNCQASAVLRASGSQPPYAFRWSHGPTDSLLSGIAPGAYTATVTDARGCTKSAGVTVPPVPRIQVTPSFQTPSCGASDGSIAFQLSPSSVSVDWAPATPGSGSNPRTGLPSGDYLARFSTPEGCRDSALFSLPAAPGCGPAGFRLFPSFSPNGDGVNDELVIQPRDCASSSLEDCFPENELMVFNRWQELVFQAKPYRNDWTAPGLPGGVYFYVFKPFGDGRDLARGSLLLIK